MMFWGCYMLFSPLISVLSWIPLVGWLLSGAVKIAAFIVAGVFSIIFSTLTISAAWLVYRPLYGLLLLSICAATIYLTFYFDWTQLNDGVPSEAAQ
jgi:hypothetical protein